MRSREKSVGTPEPDTTASTASRSRDSSTGRMPRPAHERASRCRWRVSANGEPSRTRIVSNTPSPTVSPWSSTDTVACSASTSASLHPVPRHGRTAFHVALSERPAATREQRLGLELGLLPLALSVAAPGDARAGPEPQDPVVQPERADRDGELGRPRAGVDPADRAAVGAAGRRLDRVDDPQRTRLRGAGDRPGRERRREHLGPADVVDAARPRTVDTRCTRPGVLLDREQVRHRDAAGAADRAEVVADQVDDHHVLRRVLRREVRCGPARPLDRPGLEDVAVAAQEQLGRRGHDRDAARGDPRVRAVGQVHDTGVRRGVARRQQLGETRDVDRVGLRHRRGEHPADVGLVDRARRDVLAHGLDRRHVLARATSTRPTHLAPVRPSVRSGAAAGRTSSKRANTAGPS